MSDFTTKIRKTKYGYSVKVFEDGEFYAEVSAASKERALEEAAHYVFVAENPLYKVGETYRIVLTDEGDY